jgi:hypothetical protein
LCERLARPSFVRRGTSAQEFLRGPAESDEAAKAFRFDGAKDSDMMSPKAAGLAGW